MRSCHVTVGENCFADNSLTHSLNLYLFSDIGHFVCKDILEIDSFCRCRELDICNQESSPRFTLSRVDMQLFTANIYVQVSLNGLPSLKTKQAQSRFYSRATQISNQQEAVALHKPL